MAGGIRATVEFHGPEPCPIAGLAEATDSVVDKVATSVPPVGSTPPVAEFFVEAEAPPERASVSHVLSFGDRHLLRLVHGDGPACPCECLGEVGCAVQRYFARAGTLRLVFNATDYDELRAAVGALREQFPAVDVTRLVRSPADDPSRDDVLVDRGRLTERQLEVLRIAYRMGYFDRPRRANAAEIADELDVDPSTFAEHLAAAQAKLLGDVLEDGA